MNILDAQKSLDNVSQSAIGAKAIVPGVALGLDTRGVWVGVAGNITMTMANGESILVSNVPVGFYPWSVILVASAGTTATNLVAFY